MLREVDDKTKQFCFEIYSTTNDKIKACKHDSDGKAIAGKHTVYRMSCSTCEDKNEWIKLKNNISNYGLLNNIIINFTPSHSHRIFFNKDIYSKEDIVINEYLVNDLKCIGIWSEELKEKILLNNGILDNIEEIPDIFKKIYNIIS